MCKLEIKCCGNTTNLLNHLNRRPPETPSAQSPEPNQTALEKAFVVKLRANSPCGKKISDAVATFIHKDMHPYSDVENDGFRQLVNMLEPRYLLPTRKQQNVC